MARASFAVDVDSIIPLGLQAKALQTYRKIYRPEWGLIFGGSLTITDYEKPSFALAPMLGVYLQKRISPRTAIQGEIHAKFNRQFVLRRLATDSIAAFTNGITFLDVPLSIKRFYAGKAFSLSMGLRPSLVLPMYRSFSYRKGGEFEGESGLRNLDLAVLIGMEIRINKSLAVNLRYNQGLRDFTQNDWFGEKQLHLNSDVQLSLRAKF